MEWIGGGTVRAVANYRAQRLCIWALLLALIVSTRIV